MCRWLIHLAKTYMSGRKKDDELVVRVVPEKLIQQKQKQIKDALDLQEQRKQFSRKGGFCGRALDDTSESDSDQAAEDIV